MTSWQHNINMLDCVHSQATVADIFFLLINDANLLKCTSERQSGWMWAWTSRMSYKNDFYLPQHSKNHNEITFLYSIPGIIIPGVWSVETSLLLLIAGSLIARSVSDIWMIQSVTMIESTIIAMERDKFKTTLMKYCAALPLVKTITGSQISNHHSHLWRSLTQWIFVNCRLLLWTMCCDGA